MVERQEVEMEGTGICLTFTLTDSVSALSQMVDRTRSGIMTVSVALYHSASERVL